MTEVIAPLGFTEPLSVRMKFHANDRTGDVLNTILRDARIGDVRTRSQPPSLDVEGFTLVAHQEEKGGHLSLAAILADTFAAHFDEVWVWQGV